MCVGVKGALSPKGRRQWRQKRFSLDSATQSYKHMHVSVYVLFFGTPARCRRRKASYFSAFAEACCSEIEPSTKGKARGQPHTSREGSAPVTRECARQKEKERGAPVSQFIFPRRMSMHYVHLCMRIAVHLHAHSCALQAYESLSASTSMQLLFVLYVRACGLLEEVGSPRRKRERRSPVLKQSANLHGCR